MTRKEQLRKIVEKYREKRIAYNVSLEQIEKDTMLSFDGKQKEIDTLKAAWGKARREYEAEINEFFDSWKIERKPNNDIAYQLKLHNVMQSFKLAGNSLSVEEVKQYAQPFKDDTLAIKTLAAALEDPIKSSVVKSMDTLGQEQKIKEELRKYFAGTMLVPEQLDMVVNIVMLGQLNYDEKFASDLTLA